jgi:hypothetical protein
MKRKRANRGSTMVEVLVGFVIFMILVAGMMRIVNLSSNMMMKSKDLLGQQGDFLKEFYQEDCGLLNSEEISSGTFLLTETDSTGKKKADGIQIPLEEKRIQVKKISDGDGLTVYQIDSDADSGEDEGDVGD